MQSRVTELPGGSSTGSELEDDDQKFLEKAASGQNIYFRDWVTLFYSSKDPKRRILGVTNFRVITIKQAVVGKSVRQSFPILDLSRMTVTPEKPSELVLEFGPQWLVCTVSYADSCAPIALAILFAFQSISFGRPEQKLPKISLPSFFTESFIAPNPDPQEGLLATYLAQLDYHDKSLESRLPVVEKLMTCFQNQDHVCNLSEALKHLGDQKDLSKDVLALAGTIRQSTWFTSVAAVNFKLGNAGVTALCSQLLEVATDITRLDLVAVKARGAGFQALAKSLAQGKHKLDFLNLNKNELGDAGCSTLCDALMEGKRPLTTLCLRECGLGPKGLRAVTGLFSNAGSWSTALCILDLSCNNIKRAGNQALAEWLRAETCPLEEIYLVQVGLDGEILFPALRENKKSKLQVLNVSSNNLNKKALAELATLIQDTDKLRQISLSNLGMGKKEFLAILEAVFSNQTKDVRFLLDCSSNQALGKCGKEVTELMAGIKQKFGNTTDKLEALSLNDCGLGGDGLVVFCQALQGITISSIGLSKNIKEKMFGSGGGEKSAEAVAELMKNTPSLSELTLAGTGGYALKQAVEPVIQVLLEGKSQLHHIDLSGNKMGDKLMQKFAKAVSVSPSLRSIATDGNDMGNTGLQALRDAIVQSKSLLSWETPSQDLKVLVTKFTKGPEYARAYLQDILHTIESTLEANRLAALRAGASGEGSALQRGARSSSLINQMSMTNDIGTSDGVQRIRASTLFESLPPDAVDVSWRSFIREGPTLQKVPIPEESNS